MAHTDKTKPYRIQVAQQRITRAAARHDHANGPCDLYDLPIADKATWRSPGRCHWQLPYPEYDAAFGNGAGRSNGLKHLRQTKERGARSQAKMALRAVPHLTPEGREEFDLAPYRTRSSAKWDIE